MPSRINLKRIKLWLKGVFKITFKSRVSMKYTIDNPEINSSCVNLKNLNLNAAL
jgi:hypothetical protein